MKFSFVRLPGTIVVAVTFVMGHESFTRIATPRAFDLRELNCGELLFGILVQFQ